MIKLEWYETTPDLAAKLSSIVIKDIKDNLSDISDNPSSLIFHMVFLEPNTDGPHVFVWGKTGSDAFQCQYHDNTVWE